MKLPIVSTGALALGLALGACAGTPSVPLAKNEAAPPADLAAAIRSAQLQRHAGDPDGAIRILSQVMLAAPDDPRVLGEYGKVLVDKGLSGDALAFLSRAIELQPGDWMLFSAQGVAYTQAGNYQAAQGAFARALQLNPEEPSVLNNEALAYLQTGNLDGAEQLLLRAKPNAPGYARIQQNLALVQQLKGSRRLAPSAPAIAAAPGPVSVPPVREARTEQEPAVTTVPVSPQPAIQSVARVEIPVTAPGALPAEPAPKPVVQIAATPVKISKPVPRATEPKPAIAALSATTKVKFVQISAFFVEDQATRAAEKLNGLGAHVFRGASGGRTVFRVRLGPFPDASEAISVLADVRAAGHADAMLVTDFVEQKASSVSMAPNAPALPNPSVVRSAPSLRLSQNNGFK